jgi:hypothetical protein
MDGAMVNAPHCVQYSPAALLLGFMNAIHRFFFIRIWSWELPKLVSSALLQVRFKAASTSIKTSPHKGQWWLFWLMVF